MAGQITVEQLRDILDAITEEADDRSRRGRETASGLSRVALAHKCTSNGLTEAARIVRRHAKRAGVTL